VSSHRATALVPCGPELAPHHAVADDDVDLNATPPAGEPGRGGQGGGVQTSVGKGSIDWVKTFQAAKVGGVNNYYVEQSMELTRASVAALKAMK
jgi:sugar phosphate isomerase/epimerase